MLDWFVAGGFWVLAASIGWWSPRGAAFAPLILIPALIGGLALQATVAPRIGGWMALVAVTAWVLLVWACRLSHVMPGAARRRSARNRPA